MEFALSTLADAFRNAEYVADRRDFKLFAFLAATAADDGIFPELLQALDDLHYLTGEDVLIIAPRITMAIRGQQATSDQTRHVLATGVFPQWFGPGREVEVDVSSKVREFLETQARETYSLVRFLDVPTTAIPAFLFFDSLEEPTECAMWSLKGIDSHEAVQGFRQLYENMRTECLWGAESRLESLKWELGRLRPSWKLRWESRGLLEKSKVAKKRLARARAMREVLTWVDDAKTETGRMYPIEIVERHLRLANFSTTEELELNLRRYRRRWKSRLPMEARARLKTYVDLLHLEGDPLADFDSALAAYSQTGAKLARARYDMNREVERRRSKANRRIRDLEARIAQGAARPLAAIEAFDKRRAMIRKVKAVGALLPWIRTGVSADSLFH